MTIQPICLRCRHLVRVPGVQRCEAFPAGIPREILLLEADHREPYPGDGGIRFEPRPTAAGPRPGALDP